jgi:hypothetical protein
MSFWDPRQYIRDLRSGNLDSGLARNSGGQRTLDMVVAVLRLLQASIIGLYNEVQEKRHRSRYPFIEGTAEKPPMTLLNLQPANWLKYGAKKRSWARSIRLKRTAVFGSIRKCCRTAEAFTEYCGEYTQSSTKKPAS